MKCINRKYKFHNHNRAQILISTLLVLIIVSLTVLTIVLTTVKSQKQVFENVSYYDSINSSETYIIKMSDNLSKSEFDPLDFVECEEINNEIICR